ncbi:hypothetical protein [Asticcacaulis sp. AC402]|uniref:hypothetical protein n=1 Tax=Asticcacaulis sp. AC402 TaxID=1282361 RepID=UPI0003C40A4F|nr:hypothetical protein [Asticcacaulis sp. AC402]ESQ77200.1 hypothetical protein ABAC402_02010 [Asticcacaulis sp. AC402]
MSDPSNYPRSYEYRAGTKVAWLIGGILFLLALCAGVYFAGRLNEASILPTVFTAVVAAPFAGLALACLVSAFNGRLVLFADRLEFRSYFKTRHLGFEDIERTQNAQNLFGVFVIVLVTRAGKRFTISDFGRMDDIFKDFIDRFPNKEEVAELEAESAHYDAVVTNQAFGGTAEERAANFNRNAIRVNRIGWLCLGIGFWAIFYPRPYLLCVALTMSIPPAAIAVAVLAPGRWTVHENFPGRLNLGALALIPILALVIRALSGVQQVDWTAPLATVAILTLAIFLLILKVEGGLKPTKVWAPLLMTCLYAWAATLLLNQMLDAADPSVVPLEVVGKRVLDGDHYLNLSPWAGRTREDDYEVVRQIV